MSLKFSVQFEKGAFATALDAMAEPIASAATLAIRQAADQAKLQGRASIAAAGFSTRWQNTLRADVYPKSGDSLNTAAAIYHKIPYADVFESGAQIRGKPMLWVPMSHTPKKLARKPLTAKRFATEIGDLFTIKRGRNPLLAAKMKIPKAEANRGAPYKVRMSALRRGGLPGGTGVVVSVPLFVGIRTVDIKKRFGITEAVKQAADALPQLYLANLKVD